MYKDQFNYSILGSSEKNRVVFVHGLMAFSANWRKIASRIEDRYQCLIYDQKGHGRSFKPQAGYTPEELAEDLHIITTELGWSSFHLVGHSMGARVAMVFANRYPEKLQTLTLEDMGPEVQPEAHKYYEKMLSLVPTPFADKEQMRRFFNEDFLQLFQPKESPAVLVSFLQANIEEKSNGQYDWRFSKQAIIDIVREGHRKDRWFEVSSFRMPALLVRGENSHVLPPEIFEKMQQLNPLIEAVEVRGAGHWVHYEKYEEFTEILLRFLAKHSLHNAP